MMDASQKQGFKGHEKHLIHILVPFERRFLQWALPLVPPYVSTAHLTLMTILWSCMIALAGYLAQQDLRWMWMFNAGIIFQYMTDMLDGEVGRRRDTGLIKWGFYMDHFLDYVFLCSIVIGYSFLLPASYSLWVLVCLGLTAGLMVHTLMDFAITNNFKISFNRFGVSEVRMSLVVFNILLMVAGTKLLADIFPLAVVMAVVGLGGLVYGSQKVYQHLDILQQARRDESFKLKEEPYGGNIAEIV